MNFDWKQTLAKVAPFAARMVGGPWGGLAAEAIGAVFGHEGETPPDEKQMQEYISKAKPEDLIKLKQIDADLKTRCKELDIKDDELVYKDKSDARAMQRDTKSSMPGAIVIILSLAVFVDLFCLFKYSVPDANKALVFSITGSLLTCWVSSIQFYVGTTKSSQEKTILMSIDKGRV